MIGVDCGTVAYLVIVYTLRFEHLYPWATRVDLVVEYSVVVAFVEQNVEKHVDLDEYCLVQMVVVERERMVLVILLVLAGIDYFQKTCLVGMVVMAVV
jgi:hypothetical protein